VVRARQKAKEARRRSFVSVRFVELDDRGRVRVALTNATDKDIDDIRGGIQAEDADGQFITSAGYTEAVPGSLFLAKGATLELAPFLSPRPELNKRLGDDPTSVVFSFSAQDVTYGDGTKETGLEW